MKKYSAIFMILLIIIISGLSWIGLYLGDIILASYSADFIPMAPSTSLVFLVNSAVFFILLFERDEKFYKIILFSVLTALLLFLVIILFNSFSNFLPDPEKLLIPDFVKNSRLQIGRMSPVTAVSFIILTTASLALLSGRSLLVEVSVAAAIIIVISGSVILLGYWYNAPLLYQSSVIPVALPTAICLTLSGIILILLIYNKSRLIMLFTGDSVRSKLLRGFLPAVIAVSLFEGWINSVLLPHWHMDNLAIASSVSAIFTTAVIGLIVFLISNQIGGTIDRTERALSDSEEQYRHLFETNPHPMWIYRISDLKFLAVNRSAVDHYGYSKDEFLNMTIMDIRPAEDGPRVIEKVKRSISGLDKSGTWRHIKKNGEIIFVEITTHIIKWNDFEAKLVLSYDVTDLKISEEKYRRLHESMLDAFAQTDMTGRITGTNSSFQKMLGYSAEELLNLKYPDITPKKWHDFERRLILEKLLNDGSTDIYEKEYIRKNGTVFPVEIRTFLLKGTHNEPSGMWSIVRDITERKKAEDDLRRSEERYRHIFENISDAFFLTRPDGTILTVNPAGCRMFGRTEQDICTLGRSGIIDVSDSRLEAALKIREQNGFYEGELTGIKPDGEKFPIMVSSLKFIDSDGLHSTSIIIRDITRQKEYEDNLRKFNSELERRVTERTSELEKANRELDSFSYSVSHDLRSPLRHISGFLEMFKAESADILNEKTKHYMEVIDESARRMGQLIDDLLSFSRMGRASISSNDVDTGFLVNDVIKDFSDEISESKISIRIDPLPMVKADRAMLRVVYVNLISNAVKFTKKTLKPEIIISHEFRDGENIFFVRDNGAGFDMQYADKLFGVFQRLHSDKDFSGTGIGLAMVKNIIERHKGRVWAESEPGKGSCFYFVLSNAKTGVAGNNPE